MCNNKTMRAAALLLALVLITSCFVGGTFAKYTTTASGEDTARVAYWGFTTTTMDFENLFSNDYTDAKSSDEIIAPGTSGNVEFEFVYGSGKTAPEVDYTFVVDTTGSSCADDIKNNTNIQWYFDGALAAATGKTSGTWDALIAQIEALDGDKAYKAGELPTQFAAGTKHSVGWMWTFHTDANADAADTALGNKGSNQVTLKINITATQTNGTEAVTPAAPAAGTP